ncbi:DUF6126 family protein [Kitasatospora sp. NPDC127059]|uniref:DUF6126 family protein n=1 Tax=unclassified Kitasatospora TaxID=2633591 RepID=UPI00364F32A0
MSDHTDSADGGNSADGSSAGGTGGPLKGDSASDEKRRRKAMLIRAGIYIFATHLFAGFVLLLFALGDRK